MHPLLFKVGPIPIHTYGFLIAIGFLVGLQVAKRLAIAMKENPEKILDFAFWCLLLGFVGARALFIITRFSYFASEPLEIFKIWEGGLVFFGGPLLVVPFGFWYTRKYQLSRWKLMDIVLPGLTIAHAFGRLGCLAAGCCYGKPTQSLFGIKLYSELVERELQGIPLHPTQLYEAAALLVLFFGLIYIFKRRQFNGQVGLTYFIVYPIIRSIVEVFRGDTIRGFVIDQILSTSQFISILVLALAGFVLYKRLQQTKAAS